MTIYLLQIEQFILIGLFQYNERRVAGSNQYTSGTIQISGITGGTDASNIDLIKWFYDNGTQI